MKKREFGEDSSKGTVGPAGAQNFDLSSPTGITGELPPIPKEPVSFAAVGMLTIVFSAITLLFLLFSSFSDQHAYIPPVKPAIFAQVTLTADQFKIFSNKNVCEGKGFLAGLSDAKLVVNGNNWTNTERLGVGSLNAQSQCVFTPSFDAPKSFIGGKVSARIYFTSAKTEAFTFDLGPYPPYKRIKISLTLG